MTQDDATLRQIDAADPRASTWLSANAGSGKTRVLTERVARLLLDGVSPQNILCLTYTKAAASEMQNRLFRRLGEWSMKEDAALTKDLKLLGAPGIGGPDRLAHARTLFARAIETPGGLRIQTIHSFCSSLLRRFPLEAGVSPVFREIESRSAKLLRQEIVEDLSDGPHTDCVQAVASHYTGENFDKLTEEILRHREAFPNEASTEQVWAMFGLRAGYSDADLHADIFKPEDGQLIGRLIAAMRESDKSTDQKNAAKIAQIDLSEPGHQGWESLFSVFLTGRATKVKVPFTAKIGVFPTKDVRAAFPDLAEFADQFMERLELGRPLRNSLYSAQKTLTLYQFASRFLPKYEMRKSQAGWLDFDDLISRARKLLSDPAVAQWVLFKLDGGLDHILVDEAQDTSPQQWQIIELLAQEFSSGAGARSDTHRTIFVVGDIKQSIYSFQGADPGAFNDMRQHFSKGLTAIGEDLHERSLDHSFRSSSAILSLVDATFSDIPGPGFDRIRHLAFHNKLPGRVDLWPVVPVADRPDPKEWFDPTDKLAANDHRTVLADMIANQIETLVKTDTIAEKTGEFRKIQYGDFLVLVQRRSELFHEIIRACKSRGLPIAGADRLKIGAELAVKDLTALLSFLATPQDDLSLAAALRSPLFGLSESDLFDLAYRREEKNLWPALLRRKSSHPDAVETLILLRNRTDFLAPFELLERILTYHDGRRRLLARLGPEAEDGIDAMLSQALEYERSETPSLTGFLTWLEVDAVEIKRQSDSAGDRIRVMTTHGAKGLESAIVILPDTGDRNARQNDEVITCAGSAVWKSRVELQTDGVSAVLAAEKLAQTEERQRLLYVALTRAEKWLIVCASGNVKPDGDSWYRHVEKGMAAAGALPHTHPSGSGLRLQYGEWQPVSDPPATTDREKIPHLPDWARKSAGSPPNRPVILRPSDLGGDKIIASDNTAFADHSGAQRGTQLHQLLEYLPEIPECDWALVAGQILGSGDDPATDQEISDTLSEATKVLKKPGLSFLFGPDTLSEVSVTADIAGLGGRRVSGVIDRLVVGSDSVLIVDFKSNQQVPNSAGAVPDGILRQMGAYLAAIEIIYPDRKIDVAILWTRTAELMTLPSDSVRSALRDVAPP